jgi:hypothetical protein
MNKSIVCLLSIGLVGGFFAESDAGDNAGATVYLQPLVAPIPKVEDVVAVEVFAEGMVNAQKVSITLEIGPDFSGPFDSVIFREDIGWRQVRQPTFSPEDGTISVTFNHSIKLSGDHKLGTFVFFPSATFNAETTIELRQVSFILELTSEAQDIIIPTEKNIVRFDGSISDDVFIQWDNLPSYAVINLPIQRSVSGDQSASRMVFGSFPKQNPSLVVSNGKTGSLEIYTFIGGSYEYSILSPQINNEVINCMEIGYINTNGTPELIIGTTSGNIYGVSGPEEDSKLRHIESFTDGISGISIGQLSNDSLPDMCVVLDGPPDPSVYTNLVYILEQKVDGTFDKISLNTDEFYEFVGSGFNVEKKWGFFIEDLLLADFTNDEQLDIVLSVTGLWDEPYVVGILSPNSDWSSWEQHVISKGTQFRSLKAIDIGNNDRLDIVGTGPSALIQLLNQGEMQFDLSTIHSWEGPFGSDYGYSVAVADFDLDQDPDIVVGGNMEILHSYTNNNDMSFGFSSGINVHLPVKEILTTDVNNDNFPDIIVRDDFRVYVLSGFPILKISSHSLEFKSEKVGEISSLILEISNEGNRDLIISEITSNNPLFSVQQTNFIVAQGAMKEIVVEFQTDGIGNFEGELTIISNGGDQNISLLGNTPAEAVGIPIGIDFGKVLVETSKDTSITISNSGGDTLLLEIQSSAPQILKINPSSIQIPSGDSLSIAFSFHPQSQIQYNETLTISSNDPNIQNQVIPFSGLGVKENPIIGVSISNLDFTDTPLGDIDSRTFSIENIGTSPLEITEILVDSDHFTVAPSSIASMDPGTKVIMEVNFIPASEGIQSGMLTFTSNDPDQGEIQIELSGYGLSEGPVSLDFNLADGDQGRRIGGYATPGKEFQLQINVEDSPEIEGWSLKIDYDTEQIRYVEGSFEPSSFISGLVALVLDREGGVDLGGTVLGADTKNSGDGVLGEMSFEVLEGFRDSSDIVISEVSFRRTDGRREKKKVRSIATITSGYGFVAMPGDFNGDEIVDFADFFLFADAFGGADPKYDMDGSGLVDFGDFFIFADNFGKEAQAKLIVLAQEHLGLPLVPSMEQNYPNPFNASTIISFYLVEEGLVQLDIFDLIGQRVTSFIDDVQGAGRYQVSWDGKNQHGIQVSSGIYLVKLQVNEFLEVKKMLLVK